MTQLFDMHCHLDFCDDCESIASQVAGVITAIDATVFPTSFISAREKLEEFPDIHIALGLHPWEVADRHVSEVDIAHFEDLLPGATLIGEIGLDYGKSHRDSKERQLEVLARIFQAIKDQDSGKVIFLHAVKSYDDMFMLMDKYDICKDNTCVFHWFQGTPDDFGRAISMGCMFSVGMRMLANDAGRMFASTIPDELLLVETDNPSQPGMEWSADAWTQTLENTVDALAELRGVSRTDMEALLKANSERLLS